MKHHRIPIKFVYTISFGLTSLLTILMNTQISTQASLVNTLPKSSYPANRAFFKGQNNSLQSKKKKTPPQVPNTGTPTSDSKPGTTPPNTGTPTGDSKPGTTRPQAMCKVTNKPLTAINANYGKDFTVSEFPSFWFYIPYSRQEIKSLEFVVNNEKETKTIYITSVQLLDQPGIIKITIPSKQDYSLKINETYRWYLNLKCKQNTNNEPEQNEPDQVVNGWVQRIALAPKLEKDLTSLENQKYIAYKRHDIWHDYISNLANLHFNYSGNSKFNRDWNQLLKAIDKEWVIQEKFVDSQQISLPE